jgi:hypothetical protein
MPKAYLKRFATAPTRGKRYGKLCVYERNKAVRIGTPKSESAERGFFVARDHAGALDDVSPESWAAKIEDRALDTLIYAPSPVFVWNRENRVRMAEYWALMFLRSTSFYDFHRNSSEDAFGTQIRRLNTDAEFRRRIVSHYSLLFGRAFAEEELLGTIGRALSSLLSPAEMRNQYVLQLKRRVTIFSEILLARPWQILEAPDDCEFVTCDSPVMTFRFDQWGHYYVGDGFGKESSIILLPLSPHACLIAGMHGPPIRCLPSSDVHEINKIVISASARFVYSQTRDDRVAESVPTVFRYGKVRCECLQRQ